MATISVVLSTRDRASHAEVHIGCAFPRAGTCRVGRRTCSWSITPRPTIRRRYCRTFHWPGVPTKVLTVPDGGQPAPRIEAVACARGDVLLFLDDDVVPPEDWIHRMCAPIVDGAADAVGGGVAIAGSVKEEWTRPEHEEWFASTAHWEASREPMLVGANMAIARRVFDTIGGFDEDLRSAPDSAFSLRLVNAGFRLVLRHDIVMMHYLNPTRLTRLGIERQAELRGDAQAFFVHHFGSRHVLLPRLRGMIAAARLRRYRRRNPPVADDVMHAEMKLMQDAAYWPHDRRQRVRPPRYRTDPRAEGLRHRGPWRGPSGAATEQPRRFRLALVTPNFPGGSDQRPGGMATYAARSRRH